MLCIFFEVKFVVFICLQEHFLCLHFKLLSLHECFLSLCAVMADIALSKTSWPSPPPALNCSQQVRKLSTVTLHCYSFSMRLNCLLFGSPALWPSSKPRASGPYFSCIPSLDKVANVDILSIPTFSDTSSSFSWISLVFPMHLHLC